MFSPAPNYEFPALFWAFQVLVAACLMMFYCDHVISANISCCSSPWITNLVNNFNFSCDDFHVSCTYYASVNSVKSMIAAQWDTIYRIRPCYAEKSKVFRYDILNTTPLRVYAEFIVLKLFLVTGKNFGLVTFPPTSFFLLRCWVKNNSNFCTFPCCVTNIFPERFQHFYNWVMGVV